MDTFRSDSKLLKKIIKQKKKELGSFTKFFYLIGNIILIIAPIVFVAGSSYLLKEVMPEPRSIIWSHVDYLNAYMMVLLAFGCASFIAIVGYCLKLFLDKKYCGLYVEAARAQVNVFSKFIEYGCVKDSYYNTWKINFSEIERIIIDKEKYTMRIYAPMYYREWTDEDKGTCLREDRWESDDVYITFAICFLEFDRFLEIMEKKAGKCIVQIQ